MDKLIMGIVEFREKMLPQYSKQFSKLALAQTPDALFITCSDSRVVPDLLASTHPGDLFTMAAPREQRSVSPRTRRSAQ